MKTLEEEVAELRHEVDDLKKQIKARDHRFDDAVVKALWRLKVKGRAA